MTSTFLMYAEGEGNPFCIYDAGPSMVNMTNVACYKGICPVGLGWPSAINILPEVGPRLGGLQKPP